MSRRWIAAILILGFLIRVIGLANHPVGFTPDEASFGYDAYSLLQTGKDQWGVSWPISFRSFGDFKLPLYTYLTMPFVAVLGLNELAVRLPNAILGSLAILVTYFLAKELRLRSEVKTANFNLEIIAALLLAISPWHIALSRGAFEANLTTFFLPLGILLFFKGINEKKLLFISSLVFGINLFSYHSARLLTPFLFLYLFIRYSRQIKKKSSIIFSFCIFSLFGILVLASALGGGGSRVATSAIFSPTGGWEAVANQRYREFLSGEPDWIARIFNNKVTYTMQLLQRSYLSYFSPEFLFTQGAAEATYGMIPGHGVLYIVEIAFLFSAMHTLFIRKYRNISWLVFWILISPIAAALAKGPGYAGNRAAFMIPGIQLLSAIGAVDLLGKIKNLKVRKLVFVFFSFATVICLLIYGQAYLVKQPVNHARAMIFGVKEVFWILHKNEKDYSQVVISKKISEPHIYQAFYNEVSPSIVQEESKNWLNYQVEGLAWLDQLGTYKLDKYLFTSISPNLLQRPNTLLVGEPSDFPTTVKPDYVVYYPDNTPAYYIVATNNAFIARR